MSLFSLCCCRWNRKRPMSNVDGVMTHCPRLGWLLVAGLGVTPNTQARSVNTHSMMGIKMQYTKKKNY